MIERLLAAVADWPIIVQGALGSALFAVVLFFGQKAAASITARYSVSSKNRRRGYLLEQGLKYAYKLTKDNPTRAAILTALIYRAIRHCIRAAIWLTLGLLGSTLLPVLGVVGYIGCLYYLFAALNSVAAVPDVEDVAEKMKQLKEEARALGEQIEA